MRIRLVGASHRRRNYARVAGQQYCFRGLLSVPESTLEAVVLYRPIGEAELTLLRAASFRGWPPRLPHQPIFYPVVSEEYAVQIARDWNTKDAASGYVGYVTRFAVRKMYLDRYEVRTVGSSAHLEYWIPADELGELNENLIGPIEIVAQFGRPGEHDA